MTTIEEVASHVLDGETDNPRYDELVLHLGAAIRYLAEYPSTRMIDAAMDGYSTGECYGDACTMAVKAALLAALEE